MADPILQIVDRIDATPEVLFDIAARFRVADGSTFHPPRVRRAVSTSMLVDGGFESETVYEDREIVLQLNALSGTAASQVEALQQLGRLASRPQWLLFQPPGMAHPVFFRTRRADTTIVDLLMTADPKRRITVTLPADPFAYGLPESGTVEIANNPLFGEPNPVTAPLPAAIGDVPAPLWLSFVTPAEHPSSVRNAKFRSVVASCGRPDTWTSSLGVATPFGTGSGAGTSVATSFDADFADGTRRRVTSTIVNGVRTFPITVEVDRPEDHRVFLRGRAKRASGSGRVTARLWAGGVATTLVSIARMSTNELIEYFDLGIVRLPVGSIEAGDPFGLEPMTSTVSRWNLELQFVDNPGAIFDVDHLLFVPVGDDATLATQSTYPMTGADFNLDPVNHPVRLVLDGPNDRRYASYDAEVDDLPRRRMVGASAGGLPVMRPGLGNFLTALPVVAFDPADATLTELIGSSINDSLTVDWMYFPRYLYLRGTA